MNIIKIDRSTIKEVRRPTNWQLSGRIHCFAEDIPEAIKSDIELTYQEFQSWRDETPKVDFYLPDMSKAKRIMQFARVCRKPMISVTLEDKYLMIETTCMGNVGAFSFGPQKTFDYENTPVQCSDCGAWTPYKDIEQSTYHNEDGDEFDHDKCPICKELDTFEYQFERL